MGTNKPNPERNDRIFRDVTSGMSHAEACAKYGLSRGYLIKVVCAHPDYVSKRASSSKRNQEIGRLRSEGVSEGELCRRFGISRSAVLGACARWREKNDPHRVKARVGAGAATKQIVMPTREQIAADRQLIQEYIAMRGVKICPTVALVPTQAILKPNPGIDDRWNGSTGWPASDQALRARKASRGRAVAAR